MREYKICGGTPLGGSVAVSGAKNAALPLLFAATLCRGQSILYQMPDIGDVRLAIKLLTSMGVRARWRDRHTLEIDANRMEPVSPPSQLTSGLRASAYLLGVCLAKWGWAPAIATGGCDFGARPLDCHFSVFSAMGAEGEGELKSQGGLHGCVYTFGRVSVGATVNALLAASTLPQRVELFGCATEDHVVALERFLSLCGVEIQGIGTPHLVVRGKGELEGVTFQVPPDDIEAGTYLLAAAATRGRVEVRHVTAPALESLLSTLEGAGGRVERHINSVVLDCHLGFGGVRVETAPHPGFPTDLHPPLAAALCFARGESQIKETVWADRFRYTASLIEMGADLEVVGQTLTVHPGALTGATVTATDLRGGAAMVVAALGAKGRSRILKGDVIDRGYENMGEKLRLLGADLSLL